MLARRVLCVAGTAVLFGTACTMQRRAPQSARLAMDDHMAGMTAADMAAPHIVRRTDAQGAPGLPPSASTAKARIAASPRHGEWVKIAWEPGSKDSLMAWIVYPETSRLHTPVVVVVHEIFGLSTWIRGVAPAERNMGITAAATYAMSQPSAEHTYAVIGFCWGGYTTWGYATNEGTSGFSGGVAFYGLPYMQDSVPNADSLKKVRVPMMLLNGSKDARIGAAMPAVDSAMHALHKEYVGKNYEGAIHGFARAQDDPKAQRDTVEEQANLSAIKDAWPRTVAFLKKHLGV